MEKYAPRSLVIYKVLVNHRGDTEDLFDVDDINGRTLIELFDQFCAQNENALLNATKNASKHVLLGERSFTEECLLVHLKSGSSGEHIDVIDVRSGSKAYEYDWDKASMVDSRCYLSIGHGKGYGLLCVEHVSNAAGDTVLFTPFRRFLANVDSDVVVRFEPFIETEVIDSFTSVENVVIKKYYEQNDIADSLVREGDCVTVSLTHKRGIPFNMGVIKTLLKDRKKAASLFALSGDLFDSEKSTITVELKGPAGKKGKYIFGKGIDSKIREVLNDGGQPKLSDEKFVEKCAERCSIAVERFGVKV